MATEFVGIELQLRGYEGVMSDMKKLDSMLKGFRGQKNKLEIQNNLANAKQDIIAYRGELEKLKRTQKSLSKGITENSQKLRQTKSAYDKLSASVEKFGNAYKNSSASTFARRKLSDYEKEMKRLDAQIQEQTKGYHATGAAIDETKNKLRDAQQAAREFQFALKNFSQASFMQNFKKISSAVAHVGSAMQSAGNALTKLTNPFVNFTKGMAMGAGYTALNKFSEGLSSAFDRVDTMRKYRNIMAQFNYGTKEIEDSIGKLDASVQGLPTGLDEIVGMAQRYTMTIGDMEKGTKVAIATNNAFLASMSTETQRYQGMMQLQDVLGGKDMNAREWYSLANSMMPAIRMMGEYLGKTGQELEDYVTAVSQGKIANEEFVKTLIAAGTDEKGSIFQVARKSMDTWEAFFGRIRTAAARMGQGVIESLDELASMATGGKFESINLLLDDFIISGVDNMTESLKGWIKAHPEEITDFFKSLKSINWASIAKGFGEAALGVAKLVEAFAGKFGGKDLSNIGKFMVYGNLLGNALTIGGGLLKGLRHPLGGIGAGGMEVLKELKKGGGFKGIISTMFTGKKGGNIAEAGREVAEGAATMGKMQSGLSSVFRGWGQIATMVGGTAFVGWASFKAFKSMLKDIREMTNIASGIDWSVGKKVLAGMGGFFGSFAALSAVLGRFPKVGTTLLKGEAIVGAVTTLASLVFELDMGMIKRGFKSFSDAVGYLDNALQGIQNIKSVGDVGGVKARLKNAVTLFNQIQQILAPNRNHPVFGQTEGGLQSLGGGIVRSMNNYALVIGKIKETVNKLNQLNGLQINAGNVEGLMNDLRTNLTSVYNSLRGLPSTGSMESQMTSLANSLIQVRRVIYHFNKIGSMKVSGSGGSNIRKAIEGIKSAFTDSSAGALASQIQYFATSIKNALAAVQSLNNEIVVDITFRLSDGFYSTKKKVLNEIKKAKNEIKRQRTPISFTIPVRVYFSVSTNASGAVSKIQSGASTVKGALKDAAGKVLEHTGGYIGGKNTPQYRAKGGPIFKPVGTDTVPAMLTPGEYVQRRAAVNHFGIDFMRKINQLDVKGAMDALMAKAGAHASVANRQTSITNNTYNNQRVTITNNGNTGAGFTFKNASRFVGAF